MSPARPTQSPEGPTAPPITAVGWGSSLENLSVLRFDGAPGARRAALIGEWLLGTAFVVTTMADGASASARPTGLVAAGVGALAWLGWILTGQRRTFGIALLGVLAVSGGVCGAVHESGLVLVFVSVAASCFAFSAPVAATQCALTIGAYLVAAAALDDFPAEPLALTVTLLVGLIMGVGRRGLLERSRRAGALALAERRAELANRERELVAERNRLGRDIHDVLAHTLGAVALQLTALDARVSAADDAEALRARITNLHTLVGEGLREARDAVRALGGEDLSLEEQVRRLCSQHGVRPVVTGSARPIAATTALALHRVVQESLANAAKHAPGGSISVTVCFDDATVGVAVENAPGSGRPSPLAATGGGRGLPGMHERIELLGGECRAGPQADGWRVQATLPTP